MSRWLELVAAVIVACSAVILTSAAVFPNSNSRFSNATAYFAHRRSSRPGGRSASLGPLTCYSCFEMYNHSDKRNACRNTEPTQVHCPLDTSHNSDGYSHTFCKIFWRDGQILMGCHLEQTNECRRKACVARNDSSVDSGFCCCNEPLCNSAYEMHSLPPRPSSSELPWPTPRHNGSPLRQSATVSDGRGDSGRLLSPLVLLISVASALAVLLLTVTWLFIRRRRAAALLADAESATASAGSEQKSARHNCCAVTPGDRGVTWRCVLDSTSTVGDVPDAARRDDGAELRRRVALLQRLSQGHFCTVWKATAPKLGCDKNGNSCDSAAGLYAAVKVVDPQHRRQWETERKIYELLFGAQPHANVVSFVGAADCSNEPGPASGLWIVTAYCERGSLNDYLRASTLSPVEACRVAHGIAAGLAFLHEHWSLPPTASAPQQGAHPASRADGGGRSSETAADSTVARGRRIGKPSIAHRDLKSANVLLTSDLTPRIVDFGFAVQFDPTDEHSSGCDASGGGFRFCTALQLVGTLPYMAPEMLEGAVEFTRDALLQCDVYSLGLILWELLSRTSFAQSDDGTGSINGEERVTATAAAAATARAPSPPLASYAKPYQFELGRQPTLAALQDAVAVRRVRPRAEPHWLRCRVGNWLFETATGCWDADAGARITASCAEHQLRALLDSLPRG